MNMKTIDGICYARMLRGGAARLSKYTEELNALNVFPVADGDTGTNMLKTMEGGIGDIPNDASGIGTVSAAFARGVLLGARGNSGVILSQIFAGINEGLSNRQTVTAEDLAQAYQKGITKSYAAVQNPTEGTILTVFRESAQYAASQIREDSTVEDFYRLHIEQAQKSLARTKELLPALAEADVIDSGAAGYVRIAEGMYAALRGEEEEAVFLQEKPVEKVNIDLFTRDSVLEFGYCTEFLLRLTNEKVDPDTFEIQTVLDDLKLLGGDSVVAYKQDDIVKVHVHTFHPGQVMAQMQSYGEFLTVKVENMSLGHSETPKSAKKATKPFAVVAVTSGEGIGTLFSQMGVDCTVSGGQTANPSIEEFIWAFDQCEAENILVLPNNKNILLAAQQAAKLYENAKVYVIETKSLMQGYSALSVITPGITDMEALTSSAQRAAQSVIDGEITMAVRDAVIDGKQITRGDYMAISGGSIAAVAKTAEEAVLDLLETVDMDLCEIITLFAGKEVAEEAKEQLVEQLEETYPDCEVALYDGGQDVYAYYLAVE